MPQRMRHAFGLLIVASLTAGLVASPAAAGAPQTLHVGDGSGGGVCADPEFATIQSAVDAARGGDTIVVCPGTYRELVHLTKNGLTLRAASPWTATLLPPVTVTAADRQAPTGAVGIRPYGRVGSAAAVSPANGIPLISILGADDVTVQWLRLRAPTGSPCEAMATMILVTDGAKRAHVVGNRIRPSGTATIDGPCGYGTGIAVVGASSAKVNHNLVADFQQTGVLVSEPGSHATVAGNSIRFRHTTGGSIVGGSGIYIGNEATGIVKRNAVTGLPTAYSPDPQNAASVTPVLNVGIWADSDADDVIIGHNLVAHAMYGIVVFNGSDRATVHHNVVRDSTQNGMDINGVHGAMVDGNRVAGSALDGLAVIYGAKRNVLRENDLRGNDGLDCRDTSKGGSGTGATANTWIRDLGADANTAGICTPGRVRKP